MQLNLPYYNTTSYPLAVKNQLEQLPYNKDDPEINGLHYHQYIVREFFTRNPHQRGMLIAHGMGQGKTKLAVSIAEAYRKIESRRNIIVLLPKSLEGNFRNTIAKYHDNADEKYIDKNYRFVSLNASNMFKQMYNVDKTKEELDYEKRLGNFMDDVIKNNSLDNSLLIIDEAHNLFNAITNGAKNATALYDLVMMSKNIKLIFLTGTPIINDPFELVPCFNMIRGHLVVTNIARSATDKNAHGGNDNDDKKSSRPKIGKKRNESKDTTTLFSETYEEFEDFFIDRVSKSIKNKNKFTNRIYGLVSYFGDLYYPSDGAKPGFPKKLEPVIEKVPMSQKQYASYAIARGQEQLETKHGYRSKESRFSSSKGGNSTYRVKSRQLSNYCIPEYALGPVRGAKAREKFIDKITVEDILNTDEFSPKMGKIFANVQKHHDSPGIVYSQFVSGEGLAIFARILDSHGYQNIQDSSMKPGEEYDIKTKSTKTYAIISGDIEPEERVRLITMFNNQENANGSIISLLLLSGAVAEGIDLKRVRHVHITEPFWNYARIDQVITRAIRYMSHADLPPEQQNVQVYIYLSDYPLGFPEKKKTEFTTDIDLYNKSIDNMFIINTFMKALAESSIDCMLHYPKLSDAVKKSIHCKLCSPNNMPLFHPLFNKDMELPDNCTEYSEKKVAVNEIVLPATGDKYYYRKNRDTDEIELFAFNKKLNGYTLLPRDDRHYGEVMTLVMEKIA